MDEYHDILVIGAGVSGINTAHRIKEHLPHRTLTIVEARPIIGGTWTFWKYPGIRSDSSLRLFGFTWHPWTKPHAIATGPEIAEYLTEAARADGILEKVRLRHRVVSLEWRSESQTWTVGMDADGVAKIYHANFVVACTGYYSYEKAQDSPIPGIDRFRGKAVHPQWWPEDLDYTGKRVVVVGSGATAYTLVPAMVGATKSITMLQRSPTYVVALPRVNTIEWFLSRLFLPLSWMHGISRFLQLWYEVVMSELILALPRLSRWLLTMAMSDAVPKHVDVSVHFNPDYDPFQQRLCVTPDGEFFDALKAENCEVVTDVIETVTEQGILLKSGRVLETDIIVTATGLHVELLNNITPRVDGKPINFGQQFGWRGCLIEGLPNFSFMFGNTTTTWTPAVDAVALLIIKVLKQMEADGAAVVQPFVPNRDAVPRRPAFRINSPYLLRSTSRLPMTTDRAPFQGRINLIIDLWGLRFANLKDGLAFSGKNEGKKVD